MTYADHQPLIELVIRPNVSLSQRGFTWLMIGFGLVSFVVGGFFLLKGAWPVFGFFGLDVLLLYVFFRMNYHHAARYEKIELTDEALVFSQVSPLGAKRSWRFNPHWVQVNLQGNGVDDDDIGSLVLSSHGQDVSVGSFLSPRERASLSARLNDALSEIRTQALH